MLEVVPYKLEEIKSELRKKAIEEFKIPDAEYEGSNISQLINLLAYSGVLNNTNLTFAFNEMFISQAKDRRNVLRHARQDGYIHKRKVSYQYKIKLKALKGGELTIPKYQKFTTANGNNYTYLGPDITETFGEFIKINMVDKAYSNTNSDIFNDSRMSAGNFLITEENQICEIIKREEHGEPRMLLKTIDDSELPLESKICIDIFSPEVSSEWIDAVEVKDRNGKRSLKKVGTVESFYYDEGKQEFKIQMNVDLEGESDLRKFPISVRSVSTSTLNTFKLSNGVDSLQLKDTLPFEIFSINSITMMLDGEEYTVNEGSIDTMGKNISLSPTKINVKELHQMEALELLNEDDRSTKVKELKHNLLDGSFIGVEIHQMGELFQYGSDECTLTENDGVYSIEIPSREVKEVNIEGLVANDRITIPAYLKYITFINKLTIIDPDNLEKYKMVSDDFIMNTGAGFITLKDTKYHGFRFEINMDYLLDLFSSQIYAKYSYNQSGMNGSSVTIDYNYIDNSKGRLHTSFFFSSLSGETMDQQNKFDIDSNPKGWDGFYAKSYDPELNILTFDVSESKDTKDSSGLLYNNSYLDKDGVIKKMQDLITTPFKKTRFALTEKFITDGIIHFDGYEESKFIGDIDDISVKDSIELIVKEGSVTRWDEQTEDSIKQRNYDRLAGLPLTPPEYIHTTLAFKVNFDMIDAGYFTIYGGCIEHDGIEMFVTRINEQNEKEYHKPWKRREFLLAENKQKWEINDESFVVLPNEDNEDYLNIKTSFAGTGIELDNSMEVQINILCSTGSKGGTSELIIPINNSNFEAVNIIESSNVPHILYVEGSEIEDTETIRENSQVLNNTANRAVTANDYISICQAQPYIDKVAVWGGENIRPIPEPGNVFISVIPYSRSLLFERDKGKYKLIDKDNYDLFYPTYEQITGKENYYTTLVNKDRNILFNLLNDYKVMTIKLNYVKAVYIDCSVKINVIKYTYGVSANETNENIFTAITDYFRRELEKFETIFYKSSLIRHMDKTLGDEYGIKTETLFSVTLRDNIIHPDKGNFINKTKLDMVPNAIDYMHFKNTAMLVGDNDTWMFEMALKLPIEGAFQKDTVVNTDITNKSFSEKVVRRGELITYNLTTCDTYKFLNPYDKIFVELDIDTMTSYDLNDVKEKNRPNSLSKEIILDIIYVRNWVNAFNEDGSINHDEPRYKVGEYSIYRREGFAKINLFTHYYWNIESQAVVTQQMVDEKQLYNMDSLNPYRYEQRDIGKLIFYKLDGNGKIKLDDNGNKVDTILTTAEIDAHERLLDDISLSDAPYDGRKYMKKMFADTLPSKVVYTSAAKEQSVAPSMNETDFVNFSIHKDTNEGDLAPSENFSELLRPEDVNPYNVNKKRKYYIRECPLPRKRFAEQPIKLNIIPKDNSIETTHNSFLRLDEVDFNDFKTVRRDVDYFGMVDIDLANQTVNQNLEGFDFDLDI